MQSSEPLSRVVNVRWSDADYLELRRLADAEGLKISGVIRLLVRWALLEHREPSEDDDSLSPQLLLHMLAETERQERAS